MKAKKKILLSFVGSNDAGKMIGNNDGAILTALQNEHFDEVYLLWNENKIKNSEIKYSDVILYLKREIKNRQLARKIYDEEFSIKDVTNHNEIYLQLKNFTDELNKNEKVQFTASISSGTPAMQVCWILLGESGEFSEEFPLRLIKVRDPIFGKSENIDVKLSAMLPKIVGLKKEVDNLKKDLMPIAEINIEKAELKIGESLIDLSPIELSYYRYFAERVLANEGFEKFSGITVPLSFIKKVFSFHEEMFYDLELNRLRLLNYIKKEDDFPIQTFRANISKINKKLKKQLRNETLFGIFGISIEGRRGAKFYGIKAPRGKIKIISGKGK